MLNAAQAKLLDPCNAHSVSLALLRAGAYAAGAGCKKLRLFATAGSFCRVLGIFYVLVLEYKSIFFQGLNTISSYMKCNLAPLQLHISALIK